MAQQLNVGSLRIDSPAVTPLGRIPERYTADAESVSPPLEWTGAPKGTRSFAVVVHDPDAPLVDGFTHWVLYGIPAGTTGLAEGDPGFTAGRNSAGAAGYTGPAPPSGHGLHHYYFWVYALDAELNLDEGLDRRALLGLIEDQVIEQARLIGVYER